MARCARILWRLILVAVMSAACGAGVGQSGDDAVPSPQLRPIVEVENRSHRAIEVTLEMGGRHYRLGEVPPLGAAKFEAPVGATGSVRFALLPAGEVHVQHTQLVRFAGINQLRLVIGPNMRQSTLEVRE